MKTSTSSLVTVTFSAADLVEATTGWISDVAPDCLKEGDAAMIGPACRLLHALIHAELDVVREFFKEQDAICHYCGVGNVDELFPEGTEPCVIIEWPRVLGHHPVGEPAPVVREAITLKLIGEQVSW